MTKQRVRMVSHGTVRVLEERVARRYVSGTGNDAVFCEDSVGWYATLHEWPAAIHFGPEKPDLQVGDRVKITVEKV